MLFFKQKFFSQAGVSMAEMAMATALLGGAALGLTALSGSLGDSTKKAEGTVARGEFTAALNTYLYSVQGCEDLKTAQAGGGTYSTTPAPIALSNWKYQDIPVMQGGYGANLKPLSALRYITLDQFTAYLDDTTNAPKIVAADTNGASVEMVKTILNVKAKLIVGGRPVEHLFNVPVLINPSGTLKYCSDEKTLAETCAALMGVYTPSNPPDKRCVMGEGCLLKGTYNVIECGGQVCDARYDSQTNQFTGGKSCPAGSVATQSSTTTWVSNTNTKKSSSSVTNTVTWYSCLQCPP